jgi:hypothetical protein
VEKQIIEIMEAQIRFSRTGLRSIDNLIDKHSFKIEGISDERFCGDGFWIYLKPEYKDFEFDPLAPSGIIHEDTITDCLKRLKQDVRYYKI